MRRPAFFFYCSQIRSALFKGDAGPWRRLPLSPGKQSRDADNYFKWLRKILIWTCFFICRPLFCGVTAAHFEWAPLLFSCLLNCTRQTGGFSKCPQLQRWCNRKSKLRSSQRPFKRHLICSSVCVFHCTELMLTITPRENIVKDMGAVWQLKYSPSVFLHVFNWPGYIKSACSRSEFTCLPLPWPHFRATAFLC